MKIAIGSDLNGVQLKEVLKNFIEEKLSHKVIDFGVSESEDIDYPEVSYSVAEAISKGKADRGILICGTGLGVAIAANKYPGIRAATTHDVYSAERAELSNHAQIITLGAQVIGVEPAKKVVEAYLNVEWAKGSERKVNKIIEIEKEFIQKEHQ